jgi:hypothetical protein
MSDSLDSTQGPLFEQDQHFTHYSADSPVLFTVASIFEFNISRTRSEAGWPYLTYTSGEIFDVISKKGELWLSRNQDQPEVIGWIWCKHFMNLSASPFGRCGIRNTMITARVKRPLMVSEPHTADLDQSGSWEVSRLKRVAKPCPKLEASHRYKILVASDGSSDTHALVNHFLNQLQDDDDSLTEDFDSKKSKIDGNDITIEIVDTSPDAYYSMWDEHLRSSDGFLLVYSVISRPSFALITDLFEKIDRLKVPRSVGHSWPKILMGNHADCQKLREVSKDEGFDLARKTDCTLIESTFMNEGRDMKAAFLFLIREICYLRYQNLYLSTPIQPKIEEPQKASAGHEPRRPLREIFGWGRPYDKASTIFFLYTHQEFWRATGWHGAHYGLDTQGTVLLVLKNSTHTR